MECASAVFTTMFPVPGTEKKYSVNTALLTNEQWMNADIIWHILTLPIQHCSICLQVLSEVYRFQNLLNQQTESCWFLHACYKVTDFSFTKIIEIVAYVLKKN